MDVAKTLIRTVVRAFYDTRCALVVDALFIHSVIHAEDLAYLMGMQSKDLRKVCGELKAASLIFTQSKSEIREGSNRTTSRDYYFIPYHRVIDAIKFRVFTVTNTMKNEFKQSSERKALHCPHCGASYTELEAMSNTSDEGYTCERCAHLLENEDESKVEDQTGYEKQSRLMNQLDRFLSLLKQIDQVDIPPNTFEDAWTVKVEVRRPEAPTRPRFPGQENNKLAVRGAVGSTDTANLAISISTTAELTAEQEAEEAKRKAELLAKNAAPDWFKSSSVAGAIKGADPSSMPQSNGSVSGIKRKASDIDDEAAKKTTEATTIDDELKAYYDLVAKEKAKEAEESDRSSDEEEDEDGFEDVPVSTPPVKSNGNGVSSILKSESDSPSSSAPATSTATPADSTSDPRPAKRVKIQSSDVKAEVSDEDEDEADFEDVAKPASTAPASATRAAAKREDEDSDEDEVDFEDV